MPKVVLGFSGGVDSAVCSVLLKNAGFDVYGIYLDNSSAEAKADAIAAAEFVGIPLEICDVKAELEEKVCKKFVDSYLRGETPNPCIICNPSVKFKNILSYADKIGAEFISTGHYAKAENGVLYKGNPENDQSYMLCRITREQLSRLILPLGEFPKSHVRALASKFNLPVAAKPDSMEICFIPDKDYMGYIKSRASAPPPGDLILNGRVVGTHEGIHRFTVGQRYPGLMEDKKVYISAIDPSDNSVTLCFWDELFKNEVKACDFNYLLDMPDTFDGSIRVRHTKWEEPACKVVKTQSGISALCSEPVRAPAKGQSAVIYSGDKVVGGGTICG